VDLGALLRQKKAENKGPVPRATVPAGMPIPDQGPQLQEVQQLQGLIEQMTQLCDMHVSDPQKLREQIQQAEFEVQSILSMDEGTGQPTLDHEQMLNEFKKEQDRLEKLIEQEENGDENQLQQLLEDKIRKAMNDRSQFSREVPKDLIKQRMEFLKKLGLEEECQEEMASHPNFNVEICIAKVEFLNRYRAQIPIFAAWTAKNPFVVFEIMSTLQPCMMFTMDWYMMEKCFQTNIFEKCKKIYVEWLKKHCLGPK
jgi:hypothetical protein